jgi:thioredoxin 2
MPADRDRHAVHVVCPGCDAVVRVPADRLGEAPRCPKCKAPLFTGTPVELNGPTLEVHLGRSDLPLVVDFWAPWCGPCHAMAPQFAAAARELEPRYRFAKVNTDECPDLAARFAIRSIPTLMVFRGGRLLGQRAGAMDAGSLRRWLESLAA